jgi:hypothetical protein
MRHRQHKAIDRAILGREHPLVHIIKDYPYKFLGKRHRILFHDHETNLILGLLLGPEAFISAELHDIADRFDTKMRRRKTFKH